MYQTKEMLRPDIFIHNVFDCDKSFECKLELWINPLKKYIFTTKRNQKQRNKLNITTEFY